MSSPKDSIAHLESDLRSVPPRVSVYHDLPFAIMRYNPTDEWELRREVKLLATRLESTGKDVHIISMSDLLWDALDKVHEKDDDEGFEAVVALERSRGFVEAQQQVTTYLSSKVWVPLWELLAERLAALGEENSVVFITRVAANVAGDFSHVHATRQDARANQSNDHSLLSRLNRGTTGLRFMDLKDRDALGNYRVKILRLRHR